MPYTIPSSVISPGAVYQPRQIPAVISQNARALYYTRGGSISGSLLLDQSPLNSGTRRTGEDGRCVDLNGTNQAVRVTDNAELDITDNLSVMAWVKNNNALISGQYIFAKLDTGANKREWGFGYTGSLKIIANIGSSDGSSSTSQISDAASTINVWHHVAFTFNSGSVALYLNGSLVASTASASHPSSLNNEDADLMIGAALNNNTLLADWDGQIFDARIYAGDSTVLTAAQIQSIYEDGANNIQFTGQSLRAHYKLDEQSGTTCYDSSGNGNNGTIENAVSNWGVTHDILSFQNQVGFNTSGAVYIPRDESDPANDVLGNSLTNTGRRPNDAALHSSNCLTADGILYIAAAHLAGTETVVSSGGTSTPSISAGRIDFTAGTCWDLTLSDGTHYPLSEGWGVDIGSSTSDNDGVLTNSILANAWGATQNDYHYNLVNGFSLYEHASTAAIRWPFKNESVKTLTPPTGYSKTSDNYPGDYHNNAETLIDLDPDSTPEMGSTQLGITVPASHAFGDAFAASDQIFSRQRTLTEDRFVVMPEAQTGSALATIQKYTQP